MQHKKTFTLSIILLIASNLVACNEAVVNPKPVSGSLITVEGKMILDDDTNGHEFKIGDNSTLDCNGHIIKATGDEAARTDTAIVLEGNNSAVINCIIDGYITGIRVASDIRTNTILKLKDLEREEALLHIEKLSGAATRDKLIKNNTFKNIVRTPVYVQMFNQYTTIENNQFIDAGRMAIYLDTYSAHTTITDNVIKGSGYNHSSGREGIAIDASSYNTILRNKISGSNLAGITLYKNCGEKGLPRFLGANNNIISDNHFKDETKGVWIASRADRARYPDCIDTPIYGNVARDIAQYNTVSNNTYESTDVAVDIRDNNNTVTANVLNKAVILEGSRTREIAGDPVTANQIQDNY